MLKKYELIYKQIVSYSYIGIGHNKNEQITNRQQHK